MNAPTRNGVVHMTSREFNQHTGRAKAAADHGPVVVTDRGEPAYVLLSHADYERLIKPAERSISLLEALADTRPEADFHFEFERLKGAPRDVDFGLDN